MGDQRPPACAELPARDPLFYQTLLDQSRDLLAVLSAEGTILYASPSCSWLLGRPAETVGGSDAFARVHPEEEARARAVFAAAIAADGGRVEASFRLRHHDGSYRLFKATAVSRLREPVIQGIVVHARDVTHHARTEQDHTAVLERERKALAALLSLAGTLVSPVDGGAGQGAAEVTAQHLARLTCEALGARSASITTLTSAGTWQALAMAGLTAEQERLWHSGQPGSAFRYLLTAQEQQELFTTGILAIDIASRPEGDHPQLAGITTLLFARLAAGSRLVGVLALDPGPKSRPLTDADLTVVRAAAGLAGMVIERDRLLREQAENAARALATQEATRRMDDFLALASHELRGPLASADGNIQLALRRLQRASPGQEDILADMTTLLTRAQRGLARINVLVGDLLDISRLRADRLAMHLDRHDLIGVIRDAVDEVQFLENSPPVRLTLPEAEAVCLADPARISQVVHNYLSNAIKYTPEGMPIEVTAAIEGQNLRLWVRDRGPGLPADVQARVWERFYRVEGSERRPGTRAGLGLGLYISKMIVEQHGGSVGLESTPSAGATFWFTLPLASLPPNVVS